MLLSVNHWARIRARRAAQRCLAGRRTGDLAAAAGAARGSLAQALKQSAATADSFRRQACCDHARRGDSSRARRASLAYAAAAAASRSAGLDKSIAPSRPVAQCAPLQPGHLHATQWDLQRGRCRRAFGAVAQIRRQRLEAVGVHGAGYRGRNAQPGGAAAVRRADAAAAMAQAEQEIARRGLVAAVTGLFYSSLAADHKLAVAEQARQEAADFTKLTTEREQAREAAHADVVKAQLKSSSGTAIWRMRRWPRKKRGWSWACCCFPIRARRTR